MKRSPLLKEANKERKCSPFLQNMLNEADKKREAFKQSLKETETDKVMTLYNVYIRRELQDMSDSTVDRITDRISATINYLVAGIFLSGIGIGSLATYILIK